MQKMLYKKNPHDETGEVVLLVSAYRNPDREKYIYTDDAGHRCSKYKALIMRSLDEYSFFNAPYEEVDLNKLRPLPKDYDKAFAK